METMVKTECKEEIFSTKQWQVKRPENQVAHLLNETLSFHQISKITMCINLSQAQNGISSQTSTSTNLMNTCTYQSRIYSKCLSTALSCLIQSPLPGICASKIWPCITEVWSQLERLTEKRQWGPFICNNQKSTGPARIVVQDYKHESTKQRQGACEDHITCPLECRVKMPPKMEASEVRGVGDSEELIGTFLK
jgi:hypothetical protein